MTHTETESILTRLIRMEEKLDGYLFRTSRLETRSDLHDSRIQALETGTAKVFAGASVLAFLAATFGSALIQYAQ